MATRLPPLLVVFLAPLLVLILGASASAQFHGVPPLRRKPPELADIVAQLNSKYRSVRRHGSAQLLDFVKDSPQALAAAEKALADPDVEVRLAAALWLDKFNPSVPGITPVLVEVLEAGESENFHRAVSALVKRDPNRVDFVVGRLVAIMEGYDHRLRHIAIQNLAAIGPPANAATEVLIEELERAHDPLRPLAISALAAIGGDDAMRTVRAALKDNDSIVRNEAARGLLAMKPVPPETAQELFDMLKVPSETGSNAVLDGVTTIVAVLPDTINQLTALLDNARATARMNGALALSHLGTIPDTAIPRLTQLLKDPDSGVRAGAASALAKTKQPYAPEVLQALLADINDPESYAQSAVMKALAVARDVPAVEAALTQSLFETNSIDGLDTALDAVGIDRVYAMLKDSSAATRATGLKLFSHSSYRIVPAEKASRALVPLLTDPDASIRLVAIKALGITAVCEVVDTDPDSPFYEPPEEREPDPDDREWVATAVIPALRPFLIDKDEAICTTALQAIRCMGPQAAGAMPELIRLMASNRQEVRLAAAEALGRIGSEAQRTAPALLGMLKEDNATLREAVIQTLTSIGASGAEVVKALTAALTGEDASVRAAAARALSSAGPSKDVAAPLIKASHDEDEHVAQCALESLGKLDVDDVPEISPVLVEALSGQNEEAARKALIRIGKRRPGIEKQVIAVLDAEDFNARGAAVDVLAEIGTSQAAIRLINLLAGADDEHAATGLEEEPTRALISIGPDPADVAQQILALNLDESEWEAHERHLTPFLQEISPAVVEEFAKALQEINSRRRLLALWGIGACGADAKAALPALIQSTHDRDKKCRLASIRALGRATKESNAASEALVALLATARGNYERDSIIPENDYTAIVYALRDAGAETVPVLLKALRGKNDRAAQGAAIALGAKRGDALEALPDLEQMLHDRDERLRVSAEQVLRKLGGNSSFTRPDRREDARRRRIREVGEHARRILREANVPNPPKEPVSPFENDL